MPYKHLRDKRAYDRRYRRENIMSRHRDRAHLANRRYGTPKLIAADVAAVFANRASCYYCGAPVDGRSGTLEHIDAALGNSPTNLTVACPALQLRKACPTEKRLAETAGDARHTSRGLARQHSSAAQNVVVAEAAIFPPRRKPTRFDQIEPDRLRKVCRSVYTAEPESAAFGFETHQARARL